MGRETFLLPVSWPKGGWPVILPAKTAVPQLVRRPDLASTAPVDRAAWRDDFRAPVLGHEWVMLRQPRTRWHTLAPQALTLTARTESISGTGNPSFLARRQAHSFATVETQLRYTPLRSGDRAGLAVFADEQHYYFFGLLATAEGPALAVMKRNGNDDPQGGKVVASTPLIAGASPLRLRINARGAAYDFSYSTGARGWKTLLSNADGRILASERSNQFTGTIIGALAERGPQPAGGASESRRISVKSRSAS